MVEKSLKHVIQCMPDGSVEMTLKDGELKPFEGHRKVTRMSDIIFDENNQKFYIIFRHTGYITPPMFTSYEEAIAFEVATINKERLSGVHFDFELEEENCKRLQKTP